MSQPSFDRLYEALATRSPEFDGLYFTAVKTTKIFCRPVCPAKTPMAPNVEFLPSAQAALHAGYRPCKRCKPLDMGQAAPEWIESLMARIEEDPGRRVKDGDLRSTGLDPVQVRRVFISRYGMSFHAYQRARRMGVALSGLRTGKDTLDMAMETGYESDSGFRAAFEKVVGVAPAKAANAEPAWGKWIETPLGPMLGVAVEEGLALLEFVDRRMMETQLKTFMTRFGRRIVPGDHPILLQTQTELDEYFAGTRTAFSVPLVVKGTEFQEAVWRALLQIPYGSSRSYVQQAHMIGNPGAVRAVGKANGDNRVCILIPCHRVVAADGSLCGFGGGLWRKKRLLDLESGIGDLGLDEPNPV